MASTPLRPLELPPFSLHPLLTRAFAPGPSNPLLSPTASAAGTASTPGSAPSSPPSASLARLGQLVSTVTTSSNAVPPIEPGKIPSVRSVEASKNNVWIGASDGRVRRYEVDEDASAAWERSRSPVPLLNSAGSRPNSPWSGSGGGSAGRRTPTSPTPRDMATSLEMMEEVYVTQGKKAADRIALMERLGKAVLLSEGVLTFHSLPNLAPLPVQTFPAMRGVTTFSLDEAELAGGGSPMAMHELALQGGALISTFRRNHVCIADAENYSIVDFEKSVAIPLLPISQSPNVDDRPDSMASTASGPTGPTIDPKQRPVIACVGTNEFLIASHTGSSTLGVFLTEAGEPCRGTLEWKSNLRSLVVDEPYVTALLFNDTLEIHSIHTQEIVQVIPLPRGSSSSPFTLQPRSLVRSWSGLDLGSSSGANKVDLVSVPLLPNVPIPNESPKTPTRKSLQPPATIVMGSEGGAKKGKRTVARTLLVGKNSVHALAPLTLVVQAEALIDKGRIEDALGLARQLERSSTASTLDPEIAYVYLRAAYLSLGEVVFQDAFDLFLKSACDPRLVVRMFPDLRDPLLRPGEEVKVPLGLKSEVMECRTVDELIMANLNRNYSPHIEPDVENASVTVELRAKLGIAARDAFREYLAKWRELRRSSNATTPADDSRKVNMVVDTTLVKLLAEEGRVEDVVKLLEAPNDCVVQQVEPSLREAGLFDLLAGILLKRGETRQTLDIWTKLVDGELEDARYTGGTQAVFDLLWKSKDKSTVEKYGIWLLKHDRLLGLKLFTDSEQSLTFDARDLFARIRTADADAADSFLESVVLQKRDNNSGLYGDLVKRYLDRLADLLADSDTKAHARSLERDYRSLVTSCTDSAPTFLSFLASRYDASSSTAVFDRIRLKTIIFLARSGSYDLPAAKKDLDELELKVSRGLTLERAIVYGKLKLDRQALSLLLHSLQDLSSSETFVQQSGDPLLPSELAEAAELLSLPVPKAPKKLSGSGMKKDGEEKRKADLARMLVDLCLVGSPSSPSLSDSPTTPPSSTTSHQIQVARILEAQALHLSAVDILPSIPADWSLSLLAPYLTSSLRRSLHERHEAGLLKALSVSQNLSVNERVGELQRRMGPTVEKDNGNGRRSAGAEILPEKGMASLLVLPDEAGSEEAKEKPSTGGRGDEGGYVVPASASIELENDLR